VGKANGIYQRSDNRWEARYKKGVGPNGRAVYGAVYGSSREEVEEKRRALIGEPEEEKVPTELNLLILGAGSHGRDVKEIAESLRIFQKISFLDDNVEADDVIGTCKDAMRFRGDYACAFVAIGDNRKRKKLMEYVKSMNYLLPRLIAPTAVVSPYAVIGDGTVVMSQANVGASKIGSGCILAPSCNISSDVIISDYCRIDTVGVVTKGKKLLIGTWVKSGEVFGK
jgi:UDP-N-acetylbacillosamine N-acetyltransferase